MSVPTTHQAGALCPSCGRFVGPLEKCPHCGADVQKRIPLRYLRLACLALALTGVGILLYAVSGAAVPTTKIGKIAATMNYAYVQIDGTVTRGPIYDPDAQTLRFDVADDTGEIQAATFREVTQQLIALDKVPAIGDKIRTEGALRVRDDFTSLNVASAAKLELVPPSAQEIAIRQIGRADELHLVRIRGDVREIRQPYSGLLLVTVGDSSGELDVAVNADVERLYGALPTFDLGDVVQVEGIVTYFRDAPQLVLRRPRDFKKLDIDNTAAAAVKIGDLDEARVNQRVQIAGQVTRVSRFSQGVRADVADDSGEITLVLWQDLYAQTPNAGDLQKGAQVTAIGKLSQYRGEWEIIPNRPSDLIISAPLAQNSDSPDTQDSADSAATSLPRAAVAPTETPHPTRQPTQIAVSRTIASLTEVDKDARVILRGKITRASEFSQGRRYALDDGSGEIALLIWSDVGAKIPNSAQLGQGAEVRVTGRIDVFAGALEVIPERAEQVELLAGAVVPTVPLRTIGSLSTQDLDQVVLIQGTSSEIQDFSAGKYVTMKDNSGSIRVTVFKNVLTLIQDKLALGAAIAVRGKVNLFRGNLEIVAQEISFP